MVGIPEVLRKVESIKESEDPESIRVEIGLEERGEEDKVITS